MPVDIKEINDLLHSRFDKVLVLTVPRFKDRQEKVKQRLSGIDFEFFFGVDKNELTDEYIRQQYVYDESSSLSVRLKFKAMNKGEIACALSHRKMYEAMIANNWQQVLVLEDDVIPDWENLAQLENILKELPSGWELFYLGYLKNQDITAGSKLKQAWYKLMWLLGQSRLSLKQISNMMPRPLTTHLMRSGFHDCTHAYAVSSEGAKKLTAAQTPVKHRADNLLTALILDGALNAYTSRSFLFNQEIFTDQADQSHVREPQKLSVS